jgi:transcriptional regulator GlxA family with amidase domain
LETILMTAGLGRKRLRIAAPAVGGLAAVGMVIVGCTSLTQARYIEHTGAAGADHPLRSTIAWMEENAVVALDRRAIAKHASVSIGTLHRQFREHFGTTPLALLARMRVDRARRLLETTTLELERVAEQSGFGSYSSLRYHFRRIVGVSPQKYRRSYTTGY